jgi:hypothetical protein
MEAMGGMYHMFQSNFLTWHVGPPSGRGYMEAMGGMYHMFRASS